MRSPNETNPGYAHCTSASIPEIPRPPRLSLEAYRCKLSLPLKGLSPCRHSVRQDRSALRHLGFSTPELALRRPFPGSATLGDPAPVVSYDVAIHDSCGGLTVANAGLAFADFDVVVNNDGQDHKDPYGEDAHSRDSFRNQARQNRPSAAEDQKQE
jgi:hypothetical protein